MTTASPKTPVGISASSYEPHVPQSHWRNAADEADAAKLGMWLFLSTEILLFSGFFCAYAVFRMMYPDTWQAASSHYLDWRIGGFNTAVLLLSSFTVVMAIRGAQLNRRWQVLVNLAITWVCAALFLVLKVWLEYAPKIAKGELPGGFFSYVPDGAHADYVVGAHDPIFLSIYWITTATHGFHVFVGTIVIAWVMWKSWKKQYNPGHYTSLENVGLYWHIVDVIWIFVFPLMYLV